MSKEDNGGPAFPQNPDCIAKEEQGMTLRDYFAAKAISACPVNAYQLKDFANHCYDLADAMLEARKK